MSRFLELPISLVLLPHTWLGNIFLGIRPILHTLIFSLPLIWDTNLFAVRRLAFDTATFLIMKCVCQPIVLCSCDVSCQNSVHNCTFLFIA
jgi:hypothetical protein